MYSFSVANQVSTLSHLEKRETCWWWCCYSSTCEKNRRKGKKKEKKKHELRENSKKKSKTSLTLTYILNRINLNRMLLMQGLQQTKIWARFLPWVLGVLSLLQTHTHKKSNRVSLHSCNLLVQPSLMSELVSCTKCDLPNSPGSPFGPGGPTSPEGPGGP